MQVLTLSTPTPFAPHRTIGARAFSLMEMIITVALIGVLATVAIHLAGSVPESVQATKLESDVVMLNQLVGLYVSDGRLRNI